MGANVLIAAVLAYRPGTPYSHGSHYKYDANGNIIAVDCSALVYAALRDAGYVTPSTVFNTKYLFEGTTLSQYATDNFSVIAPGEVAARNGTLQQGDIIMLRGLGTNGTSQHVGIFAGYDVNGNPTFYGAQSTPGASVATISSIDGTYWNRGSNSATALDGFAIVGALRPKDTSYDATRDTTLAATKSTGSGYSSDTPQAIVASAGGSGGADYTQYDNASATGCFYATGTEYYKDKISGDQVWRVQLDTEHGHQSRWHLARI